ncbi:hypothetical protein MYX82_08055, partial [Acidobacteria bacterium AH-259-D05]|nr:hypothetical protein [Acidobacteria bacterium AH-259-D05]
MIEGTGKPDIDRFETCEEFVEARRCLLADLGVKATIPTEEKAPAFRERNLTAIGKKELEPIQIERTDDYELVRRTFTAPGIHKHLGDDFSPSQETYRPIKHPSLVYLLASNGHPLGIFLFAPENGVCFN